MLEASARRRRRRPRRPPNPLFTRWLQEWRDEAAGTRARGTYERALRSLSRYPLPLRSGRAAAVLRHFGPGLCRRLEIRLRQHRAEQGLPPSPPAGGRVPESPLTPPTRHSPRDYRPLPRSGAHALLLTLHKSSEPLPEAELLQQAQPLCDRPLIPTAPEGALGTLLHRDLLHRSGRRPPRYSLTPRGQILAQRLAAAALEAPPPAGGTEESGEGPQLRGGHPPLSPSPLCDPEAEFELRPGEFDIVLCADVSEASGRGPAGGRVPALLRGRVRLLLRRLHVGDFLWVAREKDPPPGAPPRELMLDVVVERKAAADLGNSLTDGRYREQKFRLGRCGLRQPVYLLEEPREGKELPFPLPVLRQAAVSTQVVDGFFVKRTGGPQETAAYLGVLGEQLERRYGGRVLRAWWGDVTARAPPEPPGVPCALLPFQRLRSEGGKNQAQTVGDVFARQLLQLGGVSGRRAAAVLRRFPTPASLMAAYSSCPHPRERETLLSTVKCGPLQRNLGPSLSRSLAQLYSTPGPLP
ncbi:LOW QUALITY PROTEIN: crossover junction endonuclease MUS81 [Aquila chrysaetos chrysaetos]|uniref:LOW QUALITY PROTEIN: crossover junction endonuclease MUS81 n=1 Tax=Aquila chrysaetos chrysaetos TaxID=223781 RepID=UPI001B7D32C4|nr:LOW QUALITY PROTEIN: crossover junction endonuclease MUS81 [Aquila chrysaetos chrysaetos]